MASFQRLHNHHQGLNNSIRPAAASGHVIQQDAGRAVRITLQSSKEEGDEKAEVQLRLRNPDQLVDKMLQTLAHKFPPESVMTIAATSGVSSEGTLDGVVEGRPGAGTVAPRATGAFGSSVDVALASAPHLASSSTSSASSGSSDCASRGGEGDDLQEARGGSSGDSLEGGRRHGRIGSRDKSRSGSPSHSPSHYSRHAHHTATASQSQQGTRTSAAVTGSPSRRAARANVGEISPASAGLHRPTRLSGRHFLGLDGEYYPELADSDGQPIDAFVREPDTGGALPMGLPVVDPATGNPFRRCIAGPGSGVPVPGIPVADAGYDEQRRRPRAFYACVDGSFVREAVGDDGEPLLGYAVDRLDGHVKQVGPAVPGADGRPLAGVIRSPKGRVVPGIPLKPVPRSLPPPRQLQRQQQQAAADLGCATFGAPHLFGEREEVPAPQLQQFGTGVAASPDVVLAATTRPNYNTSSQTVVPAGPQVRSADDETRARRTAQPQLSTSGSPVAAVPLPRLQYTAAATGAKLDVAMVDSRPQYGFTVDPLTGTLGPVGPQYFDLHGRPVRDTITGPEGRPVRGIPVVMSAQSPAISSTSAGVPPLGSGTRSNAPYEMPELQYRSAAPSTTAPSPPIMWLSPDGISNVATAARPTLSSANDGRGAPTQSLKGSPPVRDGQQSAPSEAAAAVPTIPTPIRLPAPVFPLEDGSWATLAVGQDGRPLDEFAHNPQTGEIARVGRPARTQDGAVIPGKIISSNGTVTTGLAVAPHAWSITHNQPIPHYISLSEQLVPIPFSADGRLLHGLACGSDGRHASVGMQYIGASGADEGLVVRADGTVARGIALSFSSTGPAAEVDGGIGASISRRSSAPTTPRSGEHHQRYTSGGGENDEEYIPVRYVEVPLVEEKIVPVPRTEYVTIEKRVPKVERTYVERIVEVPVVEYVEKLVEVPEIEEIVKEVKTKKIIEVPKEVVCEVKKPQVKIVEKVVEVPGPIVEVPKIQYVEEKVTVPQFADKEVPTVVAQKLQPVFRQLHDVKEVPCMVTEPNVITVDVFIPKPVESVLTNSGKTKETHRVVDIPVAQFNALTRRLNLQLDAKYMDTLFAKEGAGIPMLPAGQLVETVEPVSLDWSEAHVRGRIHCVGATEMPNVNIQETFGLAPRSLAGRAARGAATERHQRDRNNRTTRNENRLHHTYRPGSSRGPSDRPRDHKEGGSHHDYQESSYAHLEHTSGRRLHHHHRHRNQ